MDKRLKNLSIKLPNNWKDVSADNPNGPPTFINNTIDISGVLQISTAEFLSGKIPNPDLSDLIDLSRNIGLKNGFGDLQNEVSGNCIYGTFGYVEFSNPRFPYTSIWHISDGENFIFATFICSIVPNREHVEDVKNILTSIRRRSLLGSLFG
jgi:hypothetical protein